MNQGIFKQLLINLNCAQFSNNSYCRFGLIKDFEKLCYHQEEPFRSSSIYAQYKVFELAKQQEVKVLLDGQGADETLAAITNIFIGTLQQAGEQA